MSLKMLVPLDGSAFAEQEISEVIRLSKIINDEIFLILFQVLELTPLLPRDREAEYILMKKNAEEYLDKLKVILEKEGLTDVKIVIKTGKVAKEICDYAYRHEVDLVVMASHGLGRALGWALGSVSYSVTRSCKTPIYVFKSRKQ